MNNARASDPITSVIAGERAALFAGNHYVRILAALGEEKSLTAAELEQITGLTVVQIDRRLPELQRQGLTRVVQFEGSDLMRNGYRVWEAV